jgi:hypothetical protein
MVLLLSFYVLHYTYRIIEESIVQDRPENGILYVPGCLSPEERINLSLRKNSFLARSNKKDRGSRHGTRSLVR